MRFGNRVPGQLTSAMDSEINAQNPTITSTALL
jgi:hypothetical protein